VGDDAVIAWALHAEAVTASVDLDVERAQELAQAAADHAARAGDQLALAWSQAALAASLRGSRREQLLEEAAREFLRRKDHRALARVYVSAAHGALVHGDAAEAQRLLETAAPYADAADQPFLAMNLAGNLGAAALMHGDFARARKAFAQHLRLCLEHEWPLWGAHGLEWLAAIAAHEGRPERAATLLGAARALADIGASRAHDALEREFYGPARGRCDPHRWRAAESLGGAMSFHDAVAYALA
jgi:non-specific serine/threonine protein kinase